MENKADDVDYIEIPAEKWYYDPGCCDVYESCEGFFLAHPKLPTAGQRFSLQAVLKKLPKEARVATVKLKEDSIHLTNHSRFFVGLSSRSTQQHMSPPT